MKPRHPLLLTLMIVSSSCVGPTLLTDGSSISFGTSSRGALRQGSRLPFQGEGYTVPTRWRERKRNYGTEELVSLLVRTSRKVHRSHRSSLLGIADLSPRGGGATLEHRSHHSGRDVDLLFYSTDDQGKPLTPQAMLYFDEQGKILSPQPASALLSSGADLIAGETAPLEPPPPPAGKLDIPRNWALIKALVTDPSGSVQWIFIGRPIANMLLRYAQQKKEPTFIIERALAVLHQPSDSQTHMDHMHVRVFCSTSDRYLGCVDTGPSRWLKKDIKYKDSPISWSMKLPDDLFTWPALNMTIAFR